MHMFSGVSVRLPDAKQVKALNPPSGHPTHQVVYIIIIIQPFIILVSHGQVRLIGPQEHILPSHRVSQVKDQVLMEREPTECTPRNPMPVPAPRTMEMAVPRGTQGLCRMSAPFSL